MKTRGVRVALSPSGNVIEPVAEPLSDLIDGPPRDFFHLQCVGPQNALRARDQMVGRDRVIGHALVWIELVELDVHSNQIAALARDDEKAAFAGRVDGGFETDVGEIGDGQDVHDAPGLIGGVAVCRSSERLAHMTVRAVAPNHVPRAYGFNLTLVRVLEPLQPDRNRIIG
jgi:hypothetical protein